MLKAKTYSCSICKTKPDQLSHHKAHCETTKHKDKTELFQLKLEKISQEELKNKYNSTDIGFIIDILINTEIDYKDKKGNKKLIMKTEEGEEINNTESESENQTEISTDKMASTENAIDISNKDALKDKIHEIHNYLRNNGAGYGMSALKVFNILYGLKRIEEANLFEKADLKVPDAQFSKFLELAKQNNKDANEKLAEMIIQNALDAIDSSNVKDLLMYEIPKGIKGNVFAHLVKEINNITKIEKSCNVLLSGKIYEYFIGRDESAISELGAYFTDRHITSFIYDEKLKPTINEDGTIGTMADIFGGSGGMTTGYINYLNNKYKINWETELNKVYHYDINEDVIKSAGLEFFCLTGVIPDMKNNLAYNNSFVDKDNKIKNKKFKYIVTNPPYGGDKIKESDTQIKRAKLKEYIKNQLKTITDDELKAKRQIQLKEIERLEKVEQKELEKSKVSVNTSSDRIQTFAAKYSLKGNDKESVSLMLIMDLIDIGGTAVGVLKEGVFFNKTYKDIRKCLIENFNVREIISVPQDQFENTSTKTSIVIFDNLADKTTTEVKFYDLVVEKYTEDKFIEHNGTIYLVECEGDIKCVGNKLTKTAKLIDILSNPSVSLNPKDYNKKEIVCGQGYELVKLGDICNFLPKSKRKASFGKELGQYNFYTSSDKVQKCDIADYANNAIIIGTGGNSSMHYASNFSCSADNLLFNTEKIDNKYIYYIIKSIWSLLIYKMRGTTIKHITKETLKDFQIPIPTSQEKIKEWVEKISKPYDEMNTKQTKIKSLETEIQTKIKNIIENEDCDEVELCSVCKVMNATKNIAIEKQNTSNNNIGFIRGSDISNNLNEPKYYITKDIYDKYYKNTNCIIKTGDILMSSCSKKFNYVKVPEKWNNFAYHGCIRISNFNNINTNYLFHYINSNIVKNILLDKQRGTTVSFTNIGDFTNLKIHIPKNKKLIEDMEPLFKELETLQNDIKTAETKYNDLIKELANEAMPNQIQNVVNETVNSNPDSESEEQKINQINDEDKKEVEVSKTKTKSKIEFKKKSKETKNTKTSFNDLINNTESSTDDI
jgi:restriction endonuclease S subunit